MSLPGKRYLFFIPFCSCLILLFTVPVVSAQAVEKPLLAWLPLLTANLQLLQPNQHCPQNKIVNMQLRKESKHLDADIAAVDWDLNCKAGLPLSNGLYKALPLSLQKENIDLQLNELLSLLADFPEAAVRIKALNLHSALLKKKLSFTVLIKKTAESVVIDLAGKQLNLKLQINLLSKQLSIDSAVALEEVEKLITLPEALHSLLHNELKIGYSSDLKHWERGALTISSQGRLADLAEQVTLTASGELALLTQQISLKKLLLNLTNVSRQLSPQQEWKTASIKLNLAEPALLNLSPFNFKSLPLQLRIGRSVVYTKVARGKSQRIALDKQKLPALFAAVRARGSLQNMSCAWRLALLKQTLTGKLLYAQDKLKAEMGETQLAPQQLVESLRSYLPDLQLLEINSGELRVQLSASYDLKTKAASLTSRVSAIDIAGKNDSVLFDGVTLHSQLDYRFEKQQLIINQDQQQLKIANLFIGIPVQALQLDARFNGGEGVIDHFKARLLGGRIDLDDFKLKAPSQTLINLSGVSLSEVIKYSAYPEIDSKAIIDGVLPLSLTAQGPVIKNGMIFARQPGGYIKVPENTVVKAMGRGNPAFTFTMQVLSDLQFDTLQGVLNYAADGESDLKIVMTGVNPTLSGTRPVTFNYSHNENILKLLKSLRFNEQLIKQIEESY